MNINSEFLLPVILITAIIISPLCYLFGKEKNEKPINLAITGFLLSFIPPLALIYLAILSLKSSDKTNDTI